MSGKYSQTYLNDLLNKFGTPEFQNVTQELLQKLINGEILSIAESNFICGSLDTFHVIDENSPHLNRYNFPQCNYYNFRYLYLIYFFDIDGYSQVNDARGIIPIERKRADIEILKNFHSEWKEIINKESINKTLNYVILEIRHQEKAIEKYGRIFMLGLHRREYLKRSSQLHGKFVFQIVSEYYEELGKEEEVLEVCNQKILIDSYAFVHILFRHFAAGIKEHQQDKTYHYDKNINFKKIPIIIRNVLLAYFEINGCNHFNNQRVYFKIVDELYVIYFRPLKRSLPENVQEQILRVQTFYPVKEIKEKNVTSNLQSVNFNEYTFYI